MIKNVWYLGVAILLFAFLILSILFVISLKSGTLETKITLAVGMLAVIITIALAFIKRQEEIKDNTIKELREDISRKVDITEIKIMKDSMDLALYQHIKYDEDRFEEVKTLVESSSETVHLIYEWIVTGKIAIKETK
jgi:hypothetical protein